MDLMLKPGEKYTRKEVQELLRVPEDRQGGDWDTGYTNYEGELYIFCNVGAAGRTGHDYPNRWDGHQLIWSAKNRSHLHQPTMQAIAERRVLPHIFWRSEDRAPFTYSGQGAAVEVQDTSPVVVRWYFPTVIGENPQLSLHAIGIANKLESMGFRLDKSYKKIWKATRQAATIYLKRDSDAYVLVIAPQFAETLDTFRSIPGVTRPLRLFYHNSNMHDFPVRIWTGKRPIPYGIDFGFESVAALDSFLRNLKDHPPSVPAIVTTDGMNVDPKTETEAMRAVRLGQQNFRRDLLNFWDGKCALTALDFPELLRASHIKPWRDCEAKERLDPDNGLLLAVHIDGLFDRGLISFDDAGGIILSNRLNEEHLSCFGISANLRISKLTQGHRKYLMHHRSCYGFHDGDEEVPGATRTIRPPA
jgi:putative restriction endonuclease